MDSDDILRGRLLTRREVLALFGAAGLAAAVGCSDSGSSKSTPMSSGSTAATTAPTPGATSAATATSAGSAVPSCIVVPALTERPYYVDEKLNRSDIRSDTATAAVKDGLPLALTFVVSQVGSACAPLADATVDVWHCDAGGVYSDVSDPSFNTKGQNFLRGYQATDAQGRAGFSTIYPGWYQGRAVHIHFKIRTNPSGASGHEFTSQLFFDDALNAEVFASQPYSQKGFGWLRNDGDMIFQQSNGQLTLAPAKSGVGYAATFDIGLQV